MAILLIEDDLDLGKLLSQYLEMNNLDIVHALDGELGLALFNQTKFELVIIDIMLPDTNGFELAKTLKNKNPRLPFIFLTARNKKEDILNGLKLGADDYITKPFEPEELVLRINIALKRRIQDKTPDLVIGNSFLKEDEYKLCTPINSYKLTPKESILLAFIIKNKNHLIKREVMLKTIWGENDYFLGRSMDVFISRLRKFFKDDPLIDIETFRSIGYIFKDK